MSSFGCTSEQGRRERPRGREGARERLKHSRVSEGSFHGRERLFMLKIGGRVRREREGERKKTLVKKKISFVRLSAEKSVGNWSETRDPSEGAFFASISSATYDIKARLIQASEE